VASTERELRSIVSDLTADYVTLEPALLAARERRAVQIGEPLCLQLDSSEESMASHVNEVTIFRDSPRIPSLDHLLAKIVHHQICMDSV